jgi:hypothetical protein
MTCKYVQKEDDHKTPPTLVVGKEPYGDYPLKFGELGWQTFLTGKS